MMIDLHCHILPGIDDGPDSLEQSVAMAKVAAADGISKIVATPHVLHPNLPPEQIKKLVNSLNDQLVVDQVPVKVFQGAEVSAQLSPHLVKSYTINNSDYVLIELPHTHLPINTGQVIFNLRINGLKPIIVHPERNPSVIKNLATLVELLDDGVYLQITAASIVGRYGGLVAKCAKKLLKKGVVHFIATDGHSTTWRRPLLSMGVKGAAKIIGTEKAAKLVNENPEAVLLNEPVPG